jgi:FdrA protein
VVNVVRTRVWPNSYRDSVALMQLSSDLGALPGVLSAAAMMGTDPNKALMAEAGILDAAGRQAGPNDLLVGVAAASVEAAERARGAAAGRLGRPGRVYTSPSPRDS